MRGREIEKLKERDVQKKCYNKNCDSLKYSDSSQVQISLSVRASSFRKCFSIVILYLSHCHAVSLWGG